MFLASLINFARSVIKFKQKRERERERESRITTFHFTERYTAYAAGWHNLTCYTTSDYETVT